MSQIYQCWIIVLVPYRKFLFSLSHQEGTSTRPAVVNLWPEGMGWMGEDRPPVALLWTVVRERVGGEVVEKRRRRHRHPCRLDA